MRIRPVVLVLALLGGVCWFRSHSGLQMRSHLACVQNLPIASRVGTACVVRRAATQTFARPNLPESGTQAAVAQLKQRGLYTSLQQAIQHTFYRPERHRDGSYALDNAAQRLQGRFSPDGVSLVVRSATAKSTMPMAGRFHSSGVRIAARASRQPADCATMRLASVGYGSQRQTMPAVAPTLAGDRVVYAHSGVSEWYVNSPQGIEQGFTLASRPAGSGAERSALQLRLSVSGDLQPRSDAGGRSAHLVCGQGGMRLAYRDLVAVDARHRRLPAWMSVSGQEIALKVDDRQAVYPITIDPLIVAETPLTAEDGMNGDQVGDSVAVSGNTVVVGAPFRNTETGAAYVFVNGLSGWTQEAELVGSERGEGSYFGSSVAVSGNTVVVGAPYRNNDAGSTYVFERSGTAWSQTMELIASDSAPAAGFGLSVGIDGNTIVVGAFGDKGIGAAYVFTRSGTSWSEQAKLTTSDGTAGDNVGQSVGISGNTVVVAAPFHKSAIGAAYLFVSAGGSWTQQAELTASDGGQGDWFGYAVGISGETVVIGAPHHIGGTAYIYMPVGTKWTQQAELIMSHSLSDSYASSVGISGNMIVAGNTNAGISTTSAFVFQNLPGGWTQQMELTNPGGLEGDEFGYAVAVSGGTLVVGDPTADGGVGSAEVVQLGPELTESSGAPQDDFGQSVAASGDLVVVGAPGVSGGAGAAYVFTNDDSGWILQQTLTAIDGAAADHFGYAVSISGDTIVVGAPNHNGSGEAYLFARQFTQHGVFWPLQHRLVAGDAAQGNSFGFSVATNGIWSVVGAYGHSHSTGAAYMFYSSTSETESAQPLVAQAGHANDTFGFSVAVGGNTLVVGAPGANSGAGLIYDFTLTATGTWKQGMPLKASDPKAGNSFGSSVGISGDTVVVGASDKNNNTAVSNGEAYVFVRSGTTWTQQGPPLTASDGTPPDYFGDSVAISGDTIVVGAEHDANPGEAYVFVRSGSTWTQPGQPLTATDGTSRDYFGCAVGISGTTTVIGAYGHNNYAGAAYIYGGPTPAANSDIYTTSQNVALTVDSVNGVLANDRDDNGLPLTAALAVAPTEGTLTLNPDGSFTYQPNAGFSGFDGFFYVATDADGNPSDLTFASLTVNKLSMKSFAASPTILIGGNKSTGQLTLNGKIPLGASAVVSLTSSSDAAMPPATVTIPGGASSVKFTIPTAAVSTSTPVTLTATFNGESLTAALTLNPAPVLKPLTLAPSTLIGGYNATATLTLTAAQKTPTTVTLASTSSAATTPASLLVAAGKKSATFQVNTLGVSNNTNVTLSATEGAQTVSASLLLQPAALLQNFTISPNSVNGGTSATGTVTITSPATTGGAIVRLVSNNTAATVPGNVNIPAGSTTASFPINTQAVTSATNATISVFYAGGGLSAPLSIQPINTLTLQSFTLSPTSVVGGASSTGTVTLSGAAPSGGALVSLSSDTASVGVPATVTIAAGQSSMTFTVSTQGVTATTTATLTASYNGGSATAQLTVQPPLPTIQSFTLSPNSVVGGMSSTGTVTLSGPAPSGGASVLVHSDTSSAGVPESVTIAGGSSSTTFPVTTQAVSTTDTATLTVAYNGGTGTAQLTVLAPTLKSLSISPSTVYAGQSSTGTLKLTSAAPVGGLSITLTSSNPAAATVPSSVTVPGGSSVVSFEISTFKSSGQSVTVTITASVNGGSVSSTLTVKPG